jgi:hypothetical protein
MPRKNAWPVRPSHFKAYDQWLAALTGGFPIAAVCDVVLMGSIIFHKRLVGCATGKGNSIFLIVYVAPSVQFEAHLMHVHPPHYVCLWPCGLNPSLERMRAAPLKIDAGVALRKRCRKRLIRTYQIPYLGSLKIQPLVFRHGGLRARIVQLYLYRPPPTDRGSAPRRAGNIPANPVF